MADSAEKPIRLERLAIVAEGLLTIAESGAFLRLSRATIYNLMDRGDLPFVKAGRARSVPKRAVLEFAAQALEGGVPPTLIQARGCHLAVKSVGLSGIISPTA